MRREFLLNEGDIYNQNYLEISVARLNQTQYFDPIDKDQDVEIRTDEEKGDVDLIVKVKEKGRQQISFATVAHPRQARRHVFRTRIFDEQPRGTRRDHVVHRRDRKPSDQCPVFVPTALFQEQAHFSGFSHVFISRYHFFGEGTVLTQNQDLLNQLYNPLGTVTTDQSNLFTQSTLGGNVFATAPLSEFFFKKRKFTQFSRIGLTYQLSRRPRSRTRRSIHLPILLAAYPRHILPLQAS